MSDCDSDYPVEWVAGLKRVHRKESFLVLWKGYPDPTDRTWEPRDHLKDNVRFHEYLEARELIDRRRR
jgi:hypothetical protein